MQAGDLVVLAASVLGPLGSEVIHENPPKFGIVESVGAGSPPVDVVVVWQDGRRVQYSAVNSGSSSVLFRIASVVGDVIIGRIVQPTAGTGIPNPGSRLQGPVTQQYGLEDPTGAAVSQAIVVDTPIGFLVIAPTDATVLQSA